MYKIVKMLQRGNGMRNDGDRKILTVAGILGIVLVAGLMLFLNQPGRALAAGLAVAPITHDAQPGDSPYDDIDETDDIDQAGAMATQSPLSTRQFVAPGGTDTGFCTEQTQPCKTITYALSQAADEGEIRVAAGIYKELIQVIQPISLTGGFTVTNWITPTWTVNQTILDGQNAYRPLTINADRVRVDGFVVRNGNATGGDRTGGGIFIGSANVVDRATLLNLRLENNVASDVESGEGGGLAVAMGNTFMQSARLTLRNITVISNTASLGSLSAIGGGMSIQAVGNSVLDVDMHNVTVQGNTAGNDFSSSGGGIAMYLNGGTARMYQLRIIDNRAAQIQTFLGGPSRGGGIFLSEGTLVMSNVLIAGNAGERGDAISLLSSGIGGSLISMNYVTLADNYRVASDAAAIIHSEGWYNYLLLSNVLFSGNPIALEARNNPQVPEVTLANVLIDNNIGQAISGTMTITGTPLRGSAGFVNAAAGDYHLAATSDAINQGNSQPPLADLDGASRPKGAASDIGAYEFAPPGVADQTITFNPLPDKWLGDAPFSVNATASSGLPVSFASRSPIVCTINGNTVTLLTAGFCTVEATQAGNADFNPAAPVTRHFLVADQSGAPKLYLPVVIR